MSKKTVIVTASSVYLPDDLIREIGIAVIPLLLMSIFPVGGGEVGVEPNGFEPKILK
jgi:hypothetical protein